MVRAMQSAATEYVLSENVKASRRCLACGVPLPPRRWRWCAVSCHQYMLASLNRRTGLLQTLGIRYATFYFTEFMVVMDLLPYDSRQIYSYMLPRAKGRKPVEDFCALSNILGNIWWNEKSRTKKRYLASKEVLSRASRPRASMESVKPAGRTAPSVRSSSLICLELRSEDLDPAHLEGRIKRAYRRQAKKHHPDLGGQPETFLKIQEAYEKLRSWAKHPTFTRQRGFPDKWFYEGACNRWIKPVMLRKRRP